MFFFQALRKAIFYEQEMGTIQTHYASDYSDFSAKVKEIEANLAQQQITSSLLMNPFPYHNAK